MRWYEKLIIWLANTLTKLIIVFGLVVVLMSIFYLIFVEPTTPMPVKVILGIIVVWLFLALLSLKIENKVR